MGAIFRLVKAPRYARTTDNLARGAPAACKAVREGHSAGRLTYKSLRTSLASMIIRCHTIMLGKLSNSGLRSLSLLGELVVGREG